MGHGGRGTLVELPEAASGIWRVGGPLEILPLPFPVTPKPPSCPHLPLGCVSPPTLCGQLPPALALGLVGALRMHTWGPEPYCAVPLV